MGKNLQESLSHFTDKVSDAIKTRKSILVTTHIDCDGITSGSIISKALIRKGAKCTVRTTNEFSQNVIEELKRENSGLYIITDLGGGSAKNLDSVLGDNWIVLDHHQIPDEEIDNQNVINAWKFGIDGGTEICAGGMTYLASTALNKDNKDLSAMAVVSALGDRQDQGEKKSFIGENQKIAKTAKEPTFPPKFRILPVAAALSIPNPAPLM